MNRLLTPLLAIALLGACANESENAAVAEPPAANAPAGADAPATPTGDAASAASTEGTAATATGTVESVDAAGGRIVIAHGPVEALKWPSMTMGFIATPEQIQAVQPGQRVTFDFNSQGPKNTITRIEPQP